MKAISAINTILYTALTVLYFYQLIYVIVALFNEKRKKKQVYEVKKLHRFAFIVAARNESAVIANLIKSIKALNLLIYSLLLIIVLIIPQTSHETAVQLSMSVFPTLR